MEMPISSSVTNRIGVVARGSASHENDENRSMDLETLSNFCQKKQVFLIARNSEKENLFVHATKIL